MHAGKVVTHCLVFVFLFLLIAILVNPLTDGIEPDLLRVAVKGVVQIAATIGTFGLYAKLLLKKSNAYFRIRRPSKTIVPWCFMGVVLPIIVIGFYLLAQYAAFEKQTPLPLSIALSYIFASFTTACSAAIIEELLFRGYLFTLIENKWNAAASIIVTSVLFGALHILTVNQPQVIDVILILVAGTLAGIMFSIIVYKSGNVWNAIAVHLFWNLILNPKVVPFAPLGSDGHSSLVLVRLKSGHPFISGGAMGIEAAIPAIVLYILAICLITLRQSNTKL